MLLLAAAAVAGCSGATGGATAAPPSAVSSTSPAASPARATPSPSPEPAAADGTRLAACRTAPCEVLVSRRDTIPVPSRLGVDRVTVKAVSGKGVTFVGTAPGVVLTLGGQRPGMTSYMNKLAITTVSISSGNAVVRIAPK